MVVLTLSSLYYLHQVIFGIVVEFVVPREEKFGGTVSFVSYTSLEEAYAKQEVYPLDLKNAVAVELNKVYIHVRTSSKGMVVT